MTMADNNDNDTMADTPSDKMLPGGNPVNYVKNGSKTESEGFAETLEWCRRASLLEHCPKLSGGKTLGVPTQCTCMHALRSQAEGKISAALYMVARWSCCVASLSNGARSTLEIEWIKDASIWAKEHGHGHASEKRMGYLLQMKATTGTLADEIHVEPLRACKHALMLVLGIGKKRWSASAMHAAANTFPVHGLTGKTGNRSAHKMARVDSDLVDFFQKLQDEAEVPATCLVRGGVRAGEEESTELPTHMTKRGLYKKYCWEQGWKLVTDAKGKYTKTPRPHDTAFPEGSEPNEIIAWATFLNYLNEKHPNLKIRASS
jgi:hypothetical protein